jgi:hypothetical protein
MVRNFTDEKQIVLGYSPYQKKNSMLNLFIQFDTFYTALQYFSFAIKGKPYMGVGRNMAYRRDFFFECKGFSRHLTIPFGDDDLFVNDHATAANTAFELSAESFMESDPKISGEDWQHQKRRHLKAGKEYKADDRQMLSFVWLGQVIFYLALIPALIFSSNIYIVLALLVLKLGVTFYIYGKVLHKFHRKYLLFYIILLDPVYHLFTLPYLSLTSNLARERNVW